MRGFTVMEMLIATTLLMAVAAVAFAVANPSQSAFQAQGEAADLQQRARVGAAALFADLVAAGAGPDRGRHAGSVLQRFAPILPYRRGSRADDPPGSAFADRITLLSIPAGAANTTVSDDATTADAGWIAVAPEPECAPDNPLCLFTAGRATAIFDGSGAVDLVTITAVASSAAAPMLEHANQPLTYAFQPSATDIAALTVVSYGFDRQNARLVVSGSLGAPDAPLVDNVVDFAIAYLGDPEPPGIDTYGPAPPPIDVQGSSPEWPPGENCVVSVEAGAQVPRLPVLAGSAALVTLSPAQLTDGPWCPDASSSNRWDADLLRVRAVIVTLRVQAAAAALRGPAGVLFAVGGTGRDPSRWVPDRQVTFQVSPRNLNLVRAP